MKIKINITKDKIKDQYYEIQNKKSIITIIYTDKSDIKSKIDTIIYDTTRNEIKHQYLENNIQYNVYMTKLMTLQLVIETL